MVPVWYYRVSMPVLMVGVRVCGASSLMRLAIVESGVAVREYITLVACSIIGTHPACSWFAIPTQVNYITSKSVWCCP